jgi:hypothetical protein
LTGFLFWTILISVPIINGPRAGTVRSKACGEVKTSVKQEAPPSIRWSSSRDYEEINSKDLSLLESSLQGFDVEKTERLLRSLASMYAGGYEKRLEDEEVRFWTNWAGIKTYKTFGGFPQLSDLELSFLFYAVGKLFVPLLLHEKGVKSESFKRLSPKEQEDAVSEVLDVIWENHLIRILQILPSLFQRISE